MQQLGDIVRAQHIAIPPSMRWPSPRLVPPRTHSPTRARTHTYIHPCQALGFAASALAAGGALAEACLACVKVRDACLSSPVPYHFSFYSSSSLSRDHADSRPFLPMALYPLTLSSIFRRQWWDCCTMKSWQKARPTPSLRSCTIPTWLGRRVDKAGAAVAAVDAGNARPNPPFCSQGTQTLPGCSSAR